MAEEEHYEDVDISDIIDDTDQYFDGDHLNTKATDSENIITIQQSDNITSEEQTPEVRPLVQVKDKAEVIRSTRLPMARIKNIMKMDPDVSVVSGDAVFLVTKATELFLETIAKEAYAYTSSNKRKVINKKDFDVVVNKVDCLCFLEGAMDF
ncbi:DNA polymerase epsilon subunit 4 [Operophtera brumata]|uniref:DNA polymerase epsilon subunit 4 n=1 Tax=Operophtera brumata TaxID=104452 RepID=A0A0L7LA15_OPEBR|nr:DNA polymerase epsilon subunit 4 [Operophtera brumata]